jgi:hypothetical protein
VTAEAGTAAVGTSLQLVGKEFNADFTWETAVSTSEMSILDKDLVIWYS